MPKAKTVFVPESGGGGVGREGGGREGGVPQFSNSSDTEAIFMINA